MTPEVKKQLDDLYNKYESLVSSKCSELEAKLSKKLLSELKKVLPEANKEALTEMAEMYINNSMTESCIHNDPSDDWDGHNRVENFVDYLDECFLEYDEVEEE